MNIFSDGIHISLFAILKLDVCRGGGGFLYVQSECAECALTEEGVKKTDIKSYYTILLNLSNTFDNLRKDISRCLERCPVVLQVDEQRQTGIERQAVISPKRYTNVKRVN